jgi:hypothetical protein
MAGAYPRALCGALKPNRKNARKWPISRPVWRHAEGVITTMPSMVWNQAKKRRHLQFSLNFLCKDQTSDCPGRESVTGGRAGVFGVQ